MLRVTALRGGTQALRQAKWFRTFSAGLSTSIDSSLTTVQLTTTPKQKLPFHELKFGNVFTDHMLEIPWKEESGWGTPKISPYHNLELDPACSCFHYGLEIFEGMKAYKDKQGKIRLFRPDKNMERLNNSAARLSLPTFEHAGFLDCIKKLVEVEESWIPDEKGYSLYIRPALISTHSYIGVASPAECLLFVILCPVGPYYPEGFNAVTLLAETQYARAFPGGTGEAKCGGNYAPTILPCKEAQDKGYSQVLWLNGEQHEVTEVGTMNQFFFWEKKGGGRELITAPLDGTILPGVTRDSILSLCRQWGEFDVTERVYTMDEVVAAIDEGRMMEAFGAGTAAIVSPVKAIGYKGKDLIIPLNKDDPDSGIGPLAERLVETIMGIQYGELSHEWSVLVN